MRSVMLSSFVFHWLMRWADVPMGIPRMVAPSIVVGMDVMHGGLSGWIIAMLLAVLSVRPMFLRLEVMNAMVSSTREALVT